MSEVRLPRVSKGERSRFFETEGLDELYGVVTSLAAELAAAYERIDTLERILTERGTIDPDAVENHEASTEDRQRRVAWHRDYIDRVFSPLRHREQDQA